ncbi:T9SS type A sorting domain-containing protein, partial [Candidatus Latescibacteria bacterium]|nr:T9SS type A sorting domain-containing protein [Candidatus Latescibacterota bacterium]
NFDEEGDNFDKEARGKLMVLAREHIGLPQVSGAEQNYPNPFNGATTIAYHVKQPGLVRLEVYDISGQRVRELTSGFHATGSYRAVWDGHDASGRNAASGVYFYALRVGEMHEVKKMLYVK